MGLFPPSLYFLLFKTDPDIPVMNILDGIKMQVPFAPRSVCFHLYPLRAEGWYSQCTTCLISWLKNYQVKKSQNTDETQIRSAELTAFSRLCKSDECLPERGTDQDKGLIPDAEAHREAGSQQTSGSCWVLASSEHLWWSHRWQSDRKRRRCLMLDSESCRLKPALSIPTEGNTRCSAFFQD